MKIKVKVWEQVDSIDLNYYLMYRVDNSGGWQRLYRVTTL